MPPKAVETLTFQNAVTQVTKASMEAMYATIAKVIVTNRKKLNFEDVKELTDQLCELSNVQITHNIMNTSSASSRSKAKGKSPSGESFTVEDYFSKIEDSKTPICAHIPKRVVKGIWPVCCSEEVVNVDEVEDIADYRCNKHLKLDVKYTPESLREYLKSSSKKNSKTRKEHGDEKKENGDSDESDKEEKPKKTSKKEKKEDSDEESTPKTKKSSKAKPEIHEVDDSAKEYLGSGSNSKLPGAGKQLSKQDGETFDNQLDDHKIIMFLPDLAGVINEEENEFMGFLRWRPANILAQGELKKDYHKKLISLEEKFKNIDDAPEKKEKEKEEEKEKILSVLKSGKYKHEEVKVSKKSSSKKEESEDEEEKPKKDKKKEKKKEESEDEEEKPKKDKKKEKKEESDNEEEVKPKKSSKKKEESEDEEEKPKKDKKKEKKEESDNEEEEKPKKSSKKKEESDNEEEVKPKPKKVQTKEPQSDDED